MTYPRPIDVMEAAIQAALDGYYNDIKNGEPRRSAEPAARDRILKAFERLMAGHTREQAFRNSMAVHQ